MADYYVGQIFINEYPPEAAQWCDENNYYIDDIEPLGNQRRFEIFAIPEPTPEEQEAEFNRQFFNTSLGYVRRSVTMKDGSRKDFLCDILPLLQVGVPVLTYTRELEQSKVLVTEQFLNECKQQLLIDFYGVQL
ncbi:hypothetical protein IKP85_06695 [bacterium]|nr:hypothetical protein [bacterium]